MKSLLNRILILNDSLVEDIKRDGEDEKLLDEIIKYDDMIREKLSIIPEFKELYIKATDAINNYYDKRISVYYVEGFKLGFKMCLEIISV